MRFLPLVCKRSREKQMSLNLIYGLILACGGFVFSRVILNFLKSDGGAVKEYCFHKDPWIYMFVLNAAVLSGVFFFSPDFYDAVVRLTFAPIGVLLVLALLIYIAFLLESDGLLYLTLSAASVALVFMVPENVLIFDGLLPYWADRLIIAGLIFVFCVSAQWLNGLSDIFAMQSIALTIGLWMVSIAGGVSHILGFAGAGLAGIWLGYMNFNRYPTGVMINNGACISAAFIFSGLLLDGTLELAGPSMLILAMYPLTEIVWALVRRYVFGVRQRDWSENTAYMSIADKGIEAGNIGIAIGKIGAVNVVLACFQLFSINGFSIPLFAFAVDLWLLGMLYNADEGKKSIKEVNQDFVKNIKEGLNNIKQSMKKGKK